MSTLKTNNIQHVDLSTPSILINSDGSVSIAGTMTYEDVTSVDAVGIITGRVLVDAQKQVHVGTGVSVKAGGLNVTAGITTVQALQATTGTFSADSTFNSVTVGKGANSVASNTVLGLAALDAAVTGGNNTAIGNNALTANTTGSDNTAVGINALDANTTGSRNNAFGSGALDENTTGTQNVAVGYRSLRLNTTASNNTAVGHQALLSNTTGSALVAVS